ncbi:MAG: helix-turn-helix transcriptional regulator [Bacteroidota bacterium]
MPINKHALIRYKTIDNCLQNRFRKWTLDDLVEACSDALYEYEGITKGVSKRSVQLDIQNMRSEKLGYNAPIIVTDKKYYSYGEKNYSITNIPLTQQDLGTLSEVVEVLKQFKGFNYFSELGGMVNRLEDKIYKQQHKGKSFIHFEKNDLLKGLEFIDPVHKAILNKQTMEVWYQSFKAKDATPLVFYPYLLKEYRNRWFAVGMKKDAGFITMALDRFVSVKELPKEKYIKNTLFDPSAFYDNAIGVTKSINQRELPVIFKLDKQNTPYAITKPIHPSQKIMKEEEDGTIFCINVIWNFELERELLGFGESVEVLAPRNLRKKIKARLHQAFSHYEKTASPPPLSQAHPGRK